MWEITVKVKLNHKPIKKEKLRVVAKCPQIRGTGLSAQLKNQLWRGEETPTGGGHLGRQSVIKHQQSRAHIFESYWTRLLGRWAVRESQRLCYWVTLWGLTVPFWCFIIEWHLDPLFEILSLSGGARGTEPTRQFRIPKRCGFEPWIRKILWSRKWQPTPELLPGKSRG